MRRLKNGSQGGSGGSFWLSFSDMMSVLVLIFIFVIFSMMFTLNEQEQKYKTAQEQYLIAEARAKASQDELDNIVSLIVEALSTRCDTFTLSGRKMPTDLVKSRFQALNSHHIEYIFECMKKSGSDIRNIKQYLLTSLFNAPATLDSYYQAKVNHDFGP